MFYFMVIFKLKVECRVYFKVVISNKVRNFSYFSKYYFFGVIFGYFVIF